MIKNAKFSGYYFDMNLNIWGDFQICISVPLSLFDIITGICSLYPLTVHILCVHHLRPKKSSLVFGNERNEFFLSFNRPHSQMCIQLFNDGGLYHIEISPLICRANQWTGFYMITASVMKELRKVL